MHYMRSRLSQKQMPTKTAEATILEWDLLLGFWLIPQLLGLWRWNLHYNNNNNNIQECPFYCVPKHSSHYEKHMI